jgi:tetratricopeptide (TPR) repeat protein
MNTAIKTLLTGTFLATLGLIVPLQATPLVVRQAASTMAPAAAPDNERSGPGKQPEPDSIDLAALYYYARNGESGRVEAETRRLELKFPGFLVPDDLYAPDPGQQVDESSLWQLYERDDYTGIDQEISRIAAAHPGWEPSDDFRAKLERRKLRNAITAAHAAKDFATLIRIGAALDPAHEADIDLLWKMIDAYRANEMREALTTVYRGILFRAPGNAFDDKLVLTTLQKAMQDVPAADLREAMEMLSADPDLALGMRSLRLDLMRREIGDFASGLSTAPQPSAETVSSVRQVADTEGAEKDIALMGWYHLKLEQPKEAAAWFERMMTKRPSAEAVRGLALSLAHLSKPDQSFALVSAHLDLLGGEDAFLVDQLSYPFKGEDTAKIDDIVVARYSEAIQKTESSDHARLLGWYAYNSRQFEPARAWFAKAFDWQPEADSLKGMVLSTGRLGQKAEVKALRETYSATYPSVFEELKAVTEPKGKSGKAVDAPGGVEAGYLAKLQKKDYGACIAELRKLEAKGPLRPDVQVAKGWCLLGLNHLAEARQSFADGLARGGGKADDAAYGLGLTLLRAHLTDDAEALLMQQKLTPLRDRELRAELLWQKARAAFDRKQYRQTLESLNARLQLVPEPVGVSQMRAWSHYHLGNLAQSRAIFAQLNQVMSDPANSRGLAAINQRMGISR